VPLPIGDFSAKESDNGGVAGNDAVLLCQVLIEFVDQILAAAVFSIAHGPVSNCSPSRCLVLSWIRMSLLVRLSARDTRLNPV